MMRRSSKIYRKGGLSHLLPTDASKNTSAKTHGEKLEEIMKREWKQLMMLVRFMYWVMIIFSEEELFNKIT
jgi:hypothetical protein